jgi:acyl-[acyl carrier protein]--UDP-N-acetylglucosamine O-acyltransferase
MLLKANITIREYIFLFSATERDITIATMVGNRCLRVDL